MKRPGGDCVMAPGLRPGIIAPIRKGGDGRGNAEPLEDLARHPVLHRNLAVAPTAVKGGSLAMAMRGESPALSALELVLVRGGWRRRSNCHQAVALPPLP